MRLAPPLSQGPTDPGGAVPPRAGRRGTVTARSVCAALTVLGTVAGACTASAADSGHPLRPARAHSARFLPSLRVGCDTPALLRAVDRANTVGGARILLAPHCTYVLRLAVASPNGPDGLPPITAPITIIGRGSTITRSSAAATPVFRIVEVRSSGSLRLVGTTLRRGRAAVDGGGILNFATTTLDASTVRDNTAAGRGGGILNESGGALRLLHATVSGNHAGQAAGIRSLGGSITLDHADISRNSASGAGGGIYAEDTNLDSFSSRIADNNGASGLGGGVGLQRISNTSVRAWFRDTRITGNTTSNDGGGLLAGAVDVRLLHSTVSGNFSGGIGGGISSTGGSLSVTSSTVTRNRAAAGGGLVTQNTTAVLKGVKITGNSAVGGGGGILNASALRATHTLIRDNTASIGEGGGVDNTGGSAVATFVESRVTRNRAGTVGGGIANGNNGRVVLIRTAVVRNTPDNCSPRGTIHGCRR